jgi:hypothetical protein
MTLAGVALALAIAVVLAPAVLAQATGAGYGLGSGRGPGGSGPGYGHGMGGPQQSLVAVAADKLGLTQAALLNELQSGKTIAQVADSKQVALNTIVDAFVAMRQTRMAQAVAAGRMTQAQADAQLATVRANVTARLSQPWSSQGPGTGFVDQNGDGVCDNAGSGRMGGGRMRGGTNP